MHIGVSDIETDGLDPTVIHCINIKIIDTKDWSVVRKISWLDIPMSGHTVTIPKVDKWVFHNGLAFDVWVLNKFNIKVDPKDVIDTIVVSKLVNYSKFRTHSLKELGEYLRVYKGEYTGGWDTRTPEMVEYCWGDVDVTVAVVKHYWKYITDPAWAKSMRVEHDMAIICQDMHDNGFTFNEGKAAYLLYDIKEEMSSLEGRFGKAFPPTRVEAKRLVYKTKKNGELFSGITKALVQYPDNELVDGELICYTLRPFNPSSPKDRVEVLWNAGWSPYDKTVGHKKFLREIWSKKL